MTYEFADNFMALDLDPPRAPRVGNAPKANVVRCDLGVSLFLHPSGQCTCEGAGDGDCEWCVMNRRREARETRRERRAAATTDGASRDLLVAAIVEQDRKRARHQAKSRRKARRGW